MLQSSPLQTDYNRYTVAGQPGTPATETGWDVDTRIFEDASPPVGIGFGLAVSQGTNDKGAIVGGAAFVGITAADKTIANLSAATLDKYSDGENMAVAVLGDWYVKVGDGVTAGDQAKYDTTTGVLGNSGTAIAGARWQTSADADGIAILRLGSSSGI